MSDITLVTGGAGFIGSHLVDRLLELGRRVVVIDNFNDFYDPAIKEANCRPHQEYESYRLVRGDIRNPKAVAECFADGPVTEIIHLAAMAGVRPSIQDPVLYQEVNLIGTMNLLEAAREHGVKQFLFASSSSVYGNNDKVPFAEEDFVDYPVSPYAATKKAGELMVYTYHHLYKFKACSLRFFTVYGPRQRPEMAIHLFTDRIVRGESIKMFGDGSSRRDYTYIDDIITGILAARDKEYGYEVLNLGRSDTVELKTLITKIEQKLGRSAIINQQPDQPGDVRQTFADISKARHLLGYQPATSIDRGLDLFIEWYNKEHKAT